MMRLFLIVAIVLGTTQVHAAEIRGSIRMEEFPDAILEVGYHARTQDDKEITNMAGVKTGGNAAEVWCDTWKPRRTSAKWAPPGDLSFAHTALPAGKYLIYVKAGMYMEWQVVDVVDEGAVAKIDFELHRDQSGALRADITEGDGDYEISLVPLPRGGKASMGGIDVTDSFHFRISADLDNTDTARLAGLRPGTYWVRLRAAEKKGSEKTGYYTTLTDLGSRKVSILEGEETRISLP